MHIYLNPNHTNFALWSYNKQGIIMQNMEIKLLDTLRQNIILYRGGSRAAAIITKRSILILQQP